MWPIPRVSPDAGFSSRPGSRRQGPRPCNWPSALARGASGRVGIPATASGTCWSWPAPSRADRKSTRLNSSHANISYAVFCLLRPPRFCPLSLHDALPILIQDVADPEGLSGRRFFVQTWVKTARAEAVQLAVSAGSRRFWSRWHPGDGEWDLLVVAGTVPSRSEEHTSELQSRQYLVCRLLLAASSQVLPSFPTRRSSDLDSGCGRSRGSLRTPVFRPDLGQDGKGRGRAIGRQRWLEALLVALASRRRRVGPAGRGRHRPEQIGRAHV